MSNFFNVASPVLPRSILVVFAHVCSFFLLLSVSSSTRVLSGAHMLVDHLKIFLLKRLLLVNSTPFYSLNFPSSDLHSVLLLKFIRNRINSQIWRLLLFT